MDRLSLTLLLVVAVGCQGTATTDAGTETDGAPRTDGPRTDGPNTDGPRTDSGPDTDAAGMDAGPLPDGSTGHDGGPIDPGSWVPPIGIPAPDFGIVDAAPAAPSPWDDAHTTAGGAQFYYVCPTCSGHTDSGNEYGTPARPRDTIPGSLDAGSVVEVHGDVDDDASFVAHGTASAPVYVRGADFASRPKLTSWMSVSGSYAIVENVWWRPADAGDSDFGVGVAEGNDHIVLRHSEASGNAERAGGIVVGSWSYGGSESASNVVVWDTDIHDLGQVVAGVDTDAHCVTANGAIDHFWLLDSQMHGCAGDGIQVEAQHGNTARIHHVYIGRNDSHHNKQSSAWVKHATDVVISQNDFHDSHAIDEFSTGQATGFQYNPDYVWFLFNRIHDCDIGVMVASDDGAGEGTESYFIGNVVYRIHAADASDIYNAGAFSMRGGVNRFVLANTTYDVDASFNAPPSGARTELVDNVFSGRTDASLFDVTFEAGDEAMSAVFASNDVYNASGAARFSWGGDTYVGVDALRAGTSTGDGCISADPLFTSVAGDDFTSQSGSPLIDSGTTHGAYATFEARYGLDIQKDAAGAARPMGAGWDIGAYER